MFIRFLLDFYWIFIGFFLNSPGLCGPKASEIIPPKIKDLKGGFTLPLSLPLETPQKSMFENGALAATKLWFLTKTLILRHAQGWPEFGRSLAGLAGVWLDLRCRHKNTSKNAWFLQRIKDPKRQNTTGPGGMREAP